jgi:hypothetical protein
MKKVTVIIWAIIIIVIAFFFNDNWAFFSQDMSPNVRFIEGPIKPLPTFVYFIIFFFFGFILAYLFNFSIRFKGRRAVKKLNATIAKQENEMAELKRELDTLKGTDTPAAEQDGTKTETKSDSDQIIELTSDSLVKNPADLPGSSSTDNQDEKTAKDSEDKADEKKS